MQKFVDGSYMAFPPGFAPAQGLDFGPAVNEGDEVAFDLLCGMGAASGAGGITYGLKTAKWIGKDHESLAVAAAGALALYALNKVLPILKRGYDTAWQKGITLTSKTLSVNDVVKAVLWGAGAAYVANGAKWPDGATLGAGVAGTLAAAYWCANNGEA